jgi:hypothetical protein
MEKCEQQLISLLVSNLERFDETKKDEADGVYNALGKFLKSKSLNTDRNYW